MVQLGPPVAGLEVDRPGRVVRRVRTPEAGPLVLSDPYYRGWTATLDGRRARILRTNPLFRRVQRSVNPSSTLGLGITVATPIGALLIVLRPVTRDRAVRPR